MRFAALGGLAGILAVVAVVLSMGGQVDGSSQVVGMAVAGLFGSLAVFLVLLGMVTGVMFQTEDASGGTR